MSDLILGWLPEYGLTVLFVTLALCAAGVPFPGTLLLVAVGSLVSQGYLPWWPVMFVSVLGAVAGDQVGYALGRWGGERVLTPVVVRRRAAAQLQRARAFAHRWGPASIFLTRWLVGPLGPWVNVSSGMAGYPWPRFLLWDVAGEVVWVGLYVTAGKVFSDEVQSVADVSSNLAWALVGLLVAAVAAWRIRHAIRTHLHAQ